MARRHVDVRANSARHTGVPSAEVEDTRRFGLDVPARRERLLISMPIALGTAVQPSSMIRT